MQSAKQRLSGIEAAKVELGNPKRVWFWGHGSEHHLLPSLFRFPRRRGEANNASSSASDSHTSGVARKAAALAGLERYSPCMTPYVPTRVLAWTERLAVALFCALVRESDHPTVFVLDPVALNAVSNVAGVARLGSQSSGRRLASRLGLSELALPGAPLASRRALWLGRFFLREKPSIPIHGRDKLPLGAAVCALCAEGRPQLMKSGPWLLRQF